jgi:hypothetical protein
MKDFNIEKDFGLDSENKNIHKLSSYFNQDFKKTAKFHPIDFISDTHYL